VLRACQSRHEADFGPAPGTRLSGLFCASVLRRGQRRRLSRQLDVLKDSGSPFSRRVDCSTLQVPSHNPAFITPGELPIDTITPGNSRLTLTARASSPIRGRRSKGGRVRAARSSSHATTASSIVPSSASCKSSLERRRRGAPATGRPSIFSSSQAKRQGYLLLCLYIKSESGFAFYAFLTCS
jgi:hypothetical protein